MRKLFQSLRDDSGTATIELALFSPLFATMMIGVADLTLAYNEKLILEQAVQRAVERVLQTTADATVEENIQQEVHEAAGIPTTQVVVTNTLYCVSNDSSPPTYTAQTDYSATCPSGDTEARYLKVVATDTYEPLFPLERIGLDEMLDIRVEAGLRTA